MPKRVRIKRRPWWRRPINLCIVAVVLFALILLGYTLLTPPKDADLPESLGNSDPPTDFVSTLARQRAQTKLKEAEPPETINDIMERYALAQGGEEQIKRVKSLRLRGHVESQGQQARFDQIKRQPDRSWLRVEIHGTPVTTVFNGEMAWRRIGDDPVGYRLDPQETAALRNAAPILSQLWSFRNDPDRLRRLSDETRDGQLFYRLELTPPDHEPLVYWIGQEDFLEHRVETHTPDGKSLVTVFDHFMPAAWLTIPGTAEVIINDETQSRVVVEKAELNNGVLAAFFEPPVEMRDWPPNEPN